jgi:Tesmin/TSO1-like CXC domain, cysteine-rich domain
VVQCAALVLMQAPEGKGCKCIKSRCVRKYCECFASGVSCHGMCICVECRNPYGARKAKPSRPHQDPLIAKAQEEAVTRPHPSMTDLPKNIMPKVQFQKLQQNSGRAGCGGPSSTYQPPQQRGAPKITFETYDDMPGAARKAAQAAARARKSNVDVDPEADARVAARLTPAAHAEEPQPRVCRRSAAPQGAAEKQSLNSLLAAVEILEGDTASGGATPHENDRGGRGGGNGVVRGSFDKGSERPRQPGEPDPGERYMVPGTTVLHPYGAPPATLMGPAWDFLLPPHGSLPPLHKPPAHLPPPPYSSRSAALRTERACRCIDSGYTGHPVGARWTEAVAHSLSIPYTGGALAFANDTWMGGRGCPDSVSERVTDAQMRGVSDGPQPGYSARRALPLKRKAPAPSEWQLAYHAAQRQQRIVSSFPPNAQRDESPRSWAPAASQSCPLRHGEDSGQMGYVTSGSKRMQHCTDFGHARSYQYQADDVQDGMGAPYETSQYHWSTAQHARGAPGYDQRTPAAPQAYRQGDWADARRQKCSRQRVVGPEGYEPVPLAVHPGERSPVLAMHKADAPGRPCEPSLVRTAQYSTSLEHEKDTPPPDTTDEDWSPQAPSLAGDAPPDDTATPHAKRPISADSTSSAARGDNSLFDGPNPFQALSTGHEKAPGGGQVLDAQDNSRASNAAHLSEQEAAAVQVRMMAAPRRACCARHAAVPCMQQARSLPDSKS